ncbi:Rne/Rng family ribonuclease [bacterium]|nr:Rne/Rng family ribonuclease [bacterium]
MSKEIVVNKGKQTRIAIVENGELAELFIENQEHERTIGNIFLGKVRRIMPSIQAAFVDIGQKQDAFLHFSDLIENVEDWISYAHSDTPIIGKFKANYTTRPTKKKRRHPSGSSSGRDGDDDADEDDDEDDDEHNHLSAGRLKDKRKTAHGRQHSQHDSRRRDSDSDQAPYVDPTTFLKKDQPILVKISKEPIANKGSRVTTDISLAGRFLVLVPMANYVAVSKKILSFKERRRLRALARSLLPEGFGVIVRTVADGRSAKALDTDLNLLIEKWKKLEEKLLPGPKAPVVIHEDVNMVSSIMRDLFTEDYDHIVLDDQRLYRNIKGYVQAIAPDMVADVKFHPGPESIFEKAGIAQAVEEAFDSRVNLPSGGYLFIETTEAMHVIDVNSGRAGRGLSQEENSLRVNLEAARILSKQVRLRDLGGIIVVDFIDMRNDRNRRKVYESLKTEFRKDRAVTKVLPMSDFGLIQITRQRLRPSITKTFSLPEGTEATPRNWNERLPVAAVPVSSPAVGRLNPEDFRESVEVWLGAYKASGRTGKVKLVLHPFAAAYFKGGFFTQTMRWIFKYGVRVELAQDSSIDPLTFQFFELKTGKDITVLPKISEKKTEDRRSSSTGGSDKNGSTDTRSEQKDSQSGKDHRRDGSSSNRDQDSRRGSQDSRSSRGGDADPRESKREGNQRNEDNQRNGGGQRSQTGQRNDGGPRSEGNQRSEGGQRSEGNQRNEGGQRSDSRSSGSRDSRRNESDSRDGRSRDDDGRNSRRNETDGRDSDARSSRAGDQRDANTGRKDVAAASDDSAEHENEPRTRGGQGRSDKNRRSMSNRGRNTRRQEEDESYDEKSEQRSSGSRRPSREDKIDDKARAEDKDSPAIEPIEVAVQNESPRPETASQSASPDAEKTPTTSTEKPKAKKSAADKEKAPAKPKKKAKPKTDATAATPEEAAPEDLFSTVDAESDVASPSEDATPKKRVSPAKKAAVKREATAPGASAEKAKTAKKKPSSPPSRHRLEKYDFSQAAKAKLAPKEEPVEGNEDSDRKADNEDASS